jgi:hypothetical protein
MPEQKPTFRAAFCQARQCSPEEFVHKVFRLCLHRRALPFAAMLRYLRPRFFQNDFLLIEEAAHATSGHDLQSAIRGFYLDCQSQQSFLHNHLRFRISGRRLFRLFTKTCSTKTSPNGGTPSSVVGQMVRHRAS